MKIDILDNLYQIEINSIDKLLFDTKVVVITNETIEKLHLDNLMQKIDAPYLDSVIIKDGEEHKHLATVEHILDKLFEKKLDRKSILIGFGGGVITDITGFVASIYQRGIEFHLIPTTLLSQVDASVGGKTGVNNRFGKNLIGAFHQPIGVSIDTSFLDTLPNREFVSGVSEIIKMAIIFDEEFFVWLENNRLDNKANITYAIEKSVKIKASVVSDDEKEHGVRAKLNYGHTFCHVIEKETNYTKYLHGEAVGIGMVMANSLAVNLGIFDKASSDRVFNLIDSYDIATTYHIENIDDFYEAFFLDKKSENSVLKFILPSKLGEGIIKNNIAKSDIMTLLDSYSKTSNI
jgi:3-dehydroquinate synthase